MLLHTAYGSLTSHNGHVCGCIRASCCHRGLIASSTTPRFPAFWYVFPSIEPNDHRFQHRRLAGRNLFRLPCRVPIEPAPLLHATLHRRGCRTYCHGTVSNTRLVKPALRSALRATRMRRHWDQRSKHTTIPRLRSKQVPCRLGRPIF